MTPTSRRRASGSRSCSATMATAATGTRRPRNSKIVLVRNHEGGAGAPFVTQPSRHYLRARRHADRQRRHDQPAVRHQRGQVPESSWSSLAGTIRNCAGGVTPWGTWLTCEETGDAGHGWCFDVAPRGGDTTPLTDMGRFSHEALMVDPQHRLRLRDRGRRRLRLLSSSCPTVAAGPSRADGSTCWPSAGQAEPRSRRRLADRHEAGTCAGCASAIRWQRRESLLRAGRGQGRRALQPPRRRLVGRATTATSSRPTAAVVGEGQVFEYDPRDETLTRHLRRAGRRPSVDNPGQHHGDAARRAAALRGRRRQRLHRGRAPASA